MTDERTIQPAPDLDQHLADEVIDMRIVPQTRRLYNGQISKLIRWLAENHSNCLDDSSGGNPTVRLPLPEEVIKAYLGAAQLLGRNLQQREQYISVSTMQSICSSIAHLYRSAQLSIAPSTVTMMSNFMRGYRRRIQSLKQTGQLAVFEGKRPLSSKGYIALASYAMTSTDSRAGSLFAHLFVVLSWNLFARSHSTAQIMLHHIEWREDSLFITLPRHKGDQEGIAVYPKHCYANPLRPEICPVLALAIFVFSTGLFHREGRDWRLFSGSNVEGKFSHWLKRVLSAGSIRQQELGSLAEDLGTHSFRKGVVTYVLSFPGGPSAVAAYLRAGWSLGNVQQRYIFEGDGSDQLLGRVAAGLPLDNLNFTVLPPHFHQDFVIGIDVWVTLLTCYNDLPSSFKDCLPYLLASIVYHSTWLRENLNRDHPIFRSILFTTNLIEHMQPNVLCGRGSNIDTGMQATGIPPTIQITQQVAELVEKLAQVMSETNKNHQEMLEKLEEIAIRLPSTVGNHILQTFDINGAVPLTREHLAEQLRGVRDELRSLVEAAFERRLRPALEQATSSHESLQPNNQQQGEENYFNVWTWGGRMHSVPADFVLPSMSVKDLWALWFYGDRIARIRPYKFLAQSDFIAAKQQKKIVRARQVITAIQKFAMDAGALPPDATSQHISSLDRSASAEVLRVGYQRLLDTLDQRRAEKGKRVYQERRAGELQFTTIYKEIVTYLRAEERK